MSNEFNNNECLPSDCASCTSKCASAKDTNELPGTITLTLDDDSEIECAILTVFPAGEKEYIALLPLDENGQNLDGEVYLFTFSQAPDGSPILENIMSDEEYARAGEEFNAVVERARAAEMADENTH